MAMQAILVQLREYLGLSNPGGIWRLLAIIFALLNLKNLPSAWHVSKTHQGFGSDLVLIYTQVRLLNGLFTQMFANRRQPISKAGPAALFQPMITSSYNPPLDCDYNFHKSNSTYFADFDVARLNAVARLCGKGMAKTKADMAKEGKGSVAIMLGGVSCNFKREIKPFESFEIWTRILSWDRKWIYVISHFVKKGAFEPEGYTLQPWKKAKARKEEKATGGESNGYASNGSSVKAVHTAIFASGIAKYVFKKGRLTIPPERILQNSGLLPPKSADHETPPVTSSPPSDKESGVFVPELVRDVALSKAEDLIDSTLTASAADDTWDWERVEQERFRGMKVADLFNSTEALNGEFTADNAPALGRYGDWF